MYEVNFPQFQDFNYIPVEFPHVLGSDVAGTIVKIGVGVTRLKEGDRVIGLVEH